MNKRLYHRWLVFLLIIAIAIPHRFFINTYQVLAAQTGTVTADTLNVRSKPSTASSKVKLDDGTYVYLSKGNTVTILGSKGDFYYISLKFNGKTVKGYAAKDYIKVSASESTPAPTPKPQATATVTIKQEVKLKGSVTTATLNVRSGPGTGYSRIAGLVKGASVTVLSDVTKDNSKWYGISFKQSGKTLKGYVSSVYIKLSYQTAVKAEAAASGLKIRAKAGTSSSYLKNKSGTIISLKKGKNVTITGETTISDTKWFKITFVTDNKAYTGYTQADMINFCETMTTPTVTPKPTTNPTATPKPTAVSKPTATPKPSATTKPSVTTKPTVTPTPALSFEESLTKEGFPSSYKTALRRLHEIYPNWVFEAYDTDLDWDTVIAAESKVGKNLIPNYKSVEWKSLEDKAYNWSTDTFTVFDGTTWVTASKAAVEYYMDPRNFLTTSGIFQFELLKYKSAYQNITGVENMLKGTALYGTSFSFQDDNNITQTYTYAKTFIKAAEYSGVSPYHLASRVKQEVVTGTNSLSSSVSGTYKGYEGYYNFYNIGASDSAGGGAVANGLKFAKNGNSTTAKDPLYMIPWTNPFKAILGGAYYIGKSYINRGQDTIYLQKFNMTSNSTYYHQYMSNVEAPFAEGKKVLTAYSGLLDQPIVFSIPIYDNMPKSAVAAPSTKYNPNNRMKSLKVCKVSGSSLTITPTFSQTQKDYDLIVDYSIDAVNIIAKAVSSKATVSGAGEKDLKVGSNKIVVSVTAENGDVAKYTITIVRSEQKAQVTPTPQVTQAALATQAAQITQSAQ